MRERSDESKRTKNVQSIQKRMTKTVDLRHVVDPKKRVFCSMSICFMSGTDRGPKLTGGVRRSRINTKRQRKIDASRPSSLPSSAASLQETERGQVRDRKFENIGLTQSGLIGVQVMHTMIVCVQHATRGRNEAMQIAFCCRLPYAMFSGAWFK